MGFFDRLFGTKEAAIPQPDVRFGRYSDSYKDGANYDAWDTALEKFEEEQYLESYKAFFNYLRDEEEDNVRWTEENDGIKFEIFQGSKKISGFADNTNLRAKASIAKTEQLNVGFLRRLLEKNFSMNFGRFALGESNELLVVFDTYTLDGSPYKLYFALKEMATQADKFDDLLLDEFDMLKPVEVSHLLEVPESLKEVKYNFIINEVQGVLKEVKEGPLDVEKFPGGIGYLLLNLVYKLDYLAKPEGFMMEALERMNRYYFAKDDKSAAEKNRLLCKELEKLLKRSKKSFFKEMYRVKATFGITPSVTHDRVVSFIDGELAHMDWYCENNYKKVAMSIPGFIVGYCLFNFAAPRPDRDFLHLYYQITESDYFKNLGFTINFVDEETGSLNKKSIKKAIERIIDKNEGVYPKLSPSLSSLKYDSMTEFARTYLLMVRNLDLTKVD
jgi:hypothetical protein